MDGRVEVSFRRRRVMPSIAAPSGSKARLFDQADARVRAGPLGARSAAESSQPDVGETVMPAPMALVTFPERKVTAPWDGAEKDMDVGVSCAKVQDLAIKPLDAGLRRHDDQKDRARLSPG
jgi:hypothetical protein